MGQKVNPVGFRLGVNRGWDSVWYAKKKDFGNYLIEDFKIRQYVKKNVINSGVSKVMIERTANKCYVTIYTSRPGFVIGKKGSDIDKIKNNLSKFTSNEVTLNIKEVKKPETNAYLVAENIAQQLVKRISYRRAMKRAMQSCLRLGAKGIKVSIVVGGGNIFRGISASSKGMDRSSADYTGMMATVINSLILQNSIEQKGIDTRVQSAIKIENVCESYIRRKAMRHIEKNRIVIFAAGTGNPYFTTDTAAALRASEVKCDILLKATKVDGIYDSDPEKNKNAEKLSNLSYDYVINNNLKIMDTASISLAKENKIPIMVFSIHENNSLIEIVDGRGSYTLIE